MTNVVDAKVKEMLEFFDDCVKFFNKCQKPSKKDYAQITKSCAVGFLIMGIIGYIIKLLFIPINTILLSKWISIKLLDICWFFGKGQVQLFACYLSVDSHHIQGRGLEVTGLIQSVGHVNSTVIMAPLNLLMLQVESVLNRTDQIEGNFEVFVEILFFLNRWNNDYKVALLANSVIWTKHHDVDVVSPFGLILRQDDLDCIAGADPIDGLLNNTNGSPGNLLIDSKVAQSQLLKITGMDYDLTGSALTELSLPLSDQFISTVDFGKRFESYVQHVNPSINGAFSREGLGDSWEAIDGIDEGTVSESSGWVDVQLDLLDDVNAVHLEEGVVGV